jgi:hypothetical protein
MGFIKVPLHMEHQIGNHYEDDTIKVFFWSGPLIYTP